MDNKIRSVSLIEMYEIINSLNGFDVTIRDNNPYATQLDNFGYLWVYKDSGNIYFLNKNITEDITKERALLILQPYLRKYKIKKMKI